MTFYFKNYLRICDKYLASNIQFYPGAHGDDQAWAKVDFLVTKTDQTIFLGLFSDQTNTNIQK